MQIAGQCDVTLSQPEPRGRCTNIIPYVKPQKRALSVKNNHSLGHRVGQGNYHNREKDFEGETA